MGREMVSKWIRDMLPKKCVNCGSTISLTYHHIVPVTYGGNDVPSNIAVLCSDCHSKVHYGKAGIINHNECVKLGIAKARERGIKVGRKPIDYEKVMRLISEKSTQFNDDSLVTEREIAEEAGVKYTTYAKCKRKLFAAMEQETWPYDWPKPTFRRNYPLYEHCIKELRGAL